MLAETNVLSPAVPCIVTAFTAPAYSADLPLFRTCCNKVQVVMIGHAVAMVTIVLILSYCLETGE